MVLHARHICAVNSATQKQVVPAEGQKGIKYHCPECKRGVCFKKGQIIQAHFAHLPVKNGEKPCKYFDSTNESKEHIFAKRAIQVHLNNGGILHIKQKCNNGICYKYKEIMIKLSEGESVVEEYRVSKEERADLAILKGNAVKYIIEICHRHRTIKRSYEWYEIVATSLINSYDTMIDEGSPILAVYDDRRDKNTYCSTYCEQREIDYQHQRELTRQQEETRKREEAEKAKKRQEEYYEKLRQERIIQFHKKIILKRVAKVLLPLLQTIRDKKMDLLRKKAKERMEKENIKSCDLNKIQEKLQVFLEKYDTESILEILGRYKSVLDTYFPISGKYRGYSFFTVLKKDKGAIIKILPEIRMRSWLESQLSTWKHICLENDEGVPKN